ncbi:divalent cation transporter [Guyparkeria halophila]|uniref:Divalent cation transporter n=1 Tax=Guyparkeria halophila TaxID=47960 RepID=A0ABZ0YTZ7_9GAMM|nr:divalent cation transporter [Guyparkeria halophila]WQH15646.1 divalent cation transporter [Guyparkeria halophila]
MTLEATLGLALMAGLAIPAGALVSAHHRMRSYWVEHEIDSFVSYFGGGALLAAVALVLVPFGMEHAHVASAAVAFLIGGLVFWQVSSWLKRRGTAVAQFLGMLLDFIPEGIALGAAVATGSNVAYLLALLIALQNMPEGFASFHEMRRGGMRLGRLWTIFLLAPLAGPLAAWFGFALLAAEDQVLALLMLFCSGGILYLIFEDIAPGAHMSRETLPAMGAVAGFLLGLIGAMLIH